MSEIKNICKIAAPEKLFALWAVFLLIAGPIRGSFIAILLIAGMNDLHTREVPNIACILTCVLGILSCITAENILQRLRATGINILITLAVVVLMKIFFRGSIGMGDIKLILSCAFLIDIGSILLGVCAGCLVAGIAELIKSRNLKATLPLVPYISVGIAVLSLY